MTQEPGYVSVTQPPADEVTPIMEYLAAALDEYWTAKGDLRATSVMLGVSNFFLTAAQAIALEAREITGSDTAGLSVLVSMRATVVQCIDEKLVALGHPELVTAHTDPTILKDFEATVIADLEARE